MVQVQVALIDDCFVRSFSPEDGHLHGEVDGLPRADRLLHALLNEGSHVGIDLGGFADELGEFRLILDSVEGCVLLPLENQLPTSFASQLFEAIEEVEVVTYVRNWLALRGPSLRGQAVEVVQLLISPDGDSEQAALFSDFVEAVEHFLGVGGVVEDEVADDAVEAMNGLESDLSVKDADFETLSFHPLVDTLSDSQLVGVVGEVAS